MNAMLFTLSTFVSLAVLSYGHSDLQNKTLVAKKAGVVVTLTMTKFSKTELAELWKRNIGYQYWGLIDCDNLKDWKAMNGNPWIVRGLKITIRGKQVDSYGSSYMGLTEPLSVSILRATSEKAVFEIVGSDAGGSYTAEYFVNNSELVTRVVRSGEFPTLTWEKDTYHYVHSKDIN